ncbi:MAG: hypothetical protein KDD82_07355 [Planctomycetes bacterium]|nr:hypothetical protein [Planctomycetota bacterium]
MQSGLSQLGRFSSAAAREALLHVQEQGSGALVVTSGLRDLRLTLGSGVATLEALGYELPEGGDADALIREFLCALFWEDPSVAEVPAAPNVLAEASCVRAEVPLASLVLQLCEGATELGRVQEKVGGIDSVVTVVGEPPPPDLHDPSANLFRALHDQAKGGLLVVAAERAQLDPIDSAWAVHDLLQNGQAEVEPPPAAVSLRRLRKAEGLIYEGFEPALRMAHLARGYSRHDARRGALYHRLAGSAYQDSGQTDRALECYRASLASRPEDVGCREDLLAALEAGGRADAKHTRVRLAQAYARWGLHRRALEHWGQIGDLDRAQRLEVVESLLAVGDVTEALARVKGLAATAPAGEREAWPERFAQAGADASTLRQVLALTGEESGRGGQVALVVSALLLLAVAAALFGEGWARQQISAASALARERLAGADPDRFEQARQAYAPLKAQIAPLRFASWPAGLRGLSGLNELEGFDASLATLGRDAALLHERAAAVRWREASTTNEALAALDALSRAAETEALREPLGEIRKEIEQRRAELEAKVKDLDTLLVASRYQEAIDKVRRLQAEEPETEPLWRRRELQIEFEIRPAEGTVVSADGKRVRASGPTTWIVGLPLAEGAVVTVEITCPGHVSRKVELRFEPTLKSPYDVKLVRLSTPTTLPPDPGQRSGPGLHVFDDAVQLAHAARELYNGRELSPVTEDSDLDFLRVQIPEGWRLSVNLVSRAGLSDLNLEAIDLYLSDAEGRAAEPRRVHLPDLAPRVTEEQPNTVLGVASAGVEKPHVLYAIEAALRDMLAQLDKAQ